MTYDEILNSAINTFGIDHQYNLAIEEASELIKALCKYRRYQNNVEDVLEEIADMQIMLDQLRIIFNDSAKDAQEKKIQRLAGLLRVNKQLL